MRGKNEGRASAVSTRTTIHALVARESRPEVTAFVEDLYGRQTVFLSIDTRYVTSAWEHSVTVSISGEKHVVLEVLEQCRQAVAKLGEPE